MPGLLLQKPGRKSKSKEHAQALERRLQLWSDGKIEELLRELAEIQGKLEKSGNKKDADQTAKSFAKLVFEGKMKSALRLLTTESKPLEASKEVLDTLRSKHPQGKPASFGAVLFGPVNLVTGLSFTSIDAEKVSAAALHTQGGAGPSGLDADGFKRMLCSRQFKSQGTDLCKAIANLTQRLCAEHVDPSHLSSFTACRLIALDKNPGVCPFGIGEVLRRIVGKLVVKNIE